MTDSTERLILNLSDDLEPIRPIPRVRSAFAVVLAVWATLLGLVVLNSGHGVASASLLGNRVYLASFVALVVAAMGGTASALAAGIPGRERMEMIGMLFAWVGLSLGAIACLVGMRSMEFEVSASPPGLDAMCFGQSAVLSLLPAGVMLSFLVRGWTLHPFRAAMIAMLASGALGALIVHLNCGFLGPQHVLIGHLSVPIVLAILGLYPVGVMLRRLRG